MIIGGLQKTTLVDFPETIACTVFTVGCNFRCPFCHNRDLVSLAGFKKSKIKPIMEKEFFEFLQKRRRWLDGVCLSGGEPTIHRDLPDFIQKIKFLKYKVKLDTNGTNPLMLAELYRSNLLDYVAMDVKTAFKEYEKAVNIKYKISKIKNSLKLIMQSKVNYDFRTTVVPGMHNSRSLLALANDLVKITKSIKYPAESINYFLQNFQPENCLDLAFLQKKPFTQVEMKKMLKTVQVILPKARIRGEG